MKATIHPGRDEPGQQISWIYRYAKLIVWTVDSTIAVEWFRGLCTCVTKMGKKKLLKHYPTCRYPLKYQQLRSRRYRVCDIPGTVLIVVN